ncbi:MAG: LPP20 family lipoprotein [Bacteroidaceae bacterium]|nr:LPP20 family lipoprotein [Bacteroidaceae bacterium]
MKKVLLVLLSVVFCTTYTVAQTPSWVNKRPVSEKEYIGIGMANTSDSNYIEIAKTNAYADIASQIATKVDKEAFMQTVDLDGKSRELFEEKVKNSMTAWIEGIEIKDSHTGNGKYYVYCTLDKKEYKKNADARKKEAIDKGLDYLKKGQEAESLMNLSQAALLYAQGLEYVEPWIFMELTTTIKGQKTNIPSELYNSYINVFSGMAITTNTSNIEAETFKNINIPVAACLSKNGEVIPNVKLKATFVNGDGTITPAIATDYNGTAEFYITNILSNENIQEIRIGIDDSFISSLPESYREIIGSNNFPAAKVTIVLAKGATTAFINVNDQNDLEGIERHISNILSEKYFKISEDPDAADCFVDISTKLDMGEVVTGTYNLNTCYCTLIIKIYNNQTQEFLMEYNLNNVKVLSPEHNSVEETISMCIREVMKRAKRELPNKLNKMKI